MSNDDNIPSTMLTLLVGGAAGYAAGRWIVAPWLATRGREDTTKRRSLSAGPVDPYAGPSGTMQPIDPYAGPSGAMQPIDPYAEAPVAVTPSVVTNTPTAPVPTLIAPKVDGPIMSPSAALVTTPTAPKVDGPVMSPSQVAPSDTSGPITSPSQVAIVTTPVSVGGPSATSSRVRRFDPVFERYRGNLPLAYLRALVERESDGRPSVRTGSAVGLMQIIPIVLADYNKRHGTAYPGSQLVDPALNVAIGCELLRLIADSYRRNHPRVPNLQPDWTNPRFVELLTFGWNAGFSEAGGVGRVVRYLERLGAVDITLDQVTAHARLAGASKHLSNPAKVAWCKSVVALYLRERALVDAPVSLVA